MFVGLKDTIPEYVFAGRLFLEDLVEERLAGGARMVAVTQSVQKTFPSERQAGLLHLVTFRPSQIARRHPLMEH
jgi:hypothetical protein